MIAADPNAIVARLRAGKYETIQEAVEAMANAISGVFNQQTMRRGLYNDVIADENGGTILSVSDPSAARKSISLQHPQLLRKRQMGALGTRTQRRTDIQTRTVTGVVTSISGSGASAEVTVVLIGDVPRTYVDGTTRQNQPGSPVDAYEEDPATMGGTTLTLPMTGVGFVASGEDGSKVPVVGQTVHVTLTEQNEKRTFWVTRNRKSAPYVVNYQSQAETGSLVNGVCCEEEGGGGGGS